MCMMLQWEVSLYLCPSHLSLSQHLLTGHLPHPPSLLTISLRSKQSSSHLYQGVVTVDRDVLLRVGSRSQLGFMVCWEGIEYLEKMCWRGYWEVLIVYVEESRGYACRLSYDHYPPLSASDSSPLLLHSLVLPILSLLLSWMHCSQMMMFFLCLRAYQWAGESV